jgi:hypothetical protein
MKVGNSSTPVLTDKQAQAAVRSRLNKDNTSFSSFLFRKKRNQSLVYLFFLQRKETKENRRCANRSPFQALLPPGRLSRCA